MTHSQSIVLGLGKSFEITGSAELTYFLVGRRELLIKLARLGRKINSLLCARPSARLFEDPREGTQLIRVDVHCGDLETLRVFSAAIHAWLARERVDGIFLNILS
jgi:hypothetical protein